RSNGLPGPGAGDDGVAPTPDNRALGTSFIARDEAQPMRRRSSRQAPDRSAGGPAGRSARRPRPASPAQAGWSSGGTWPSTPPARPAARPSLRPASPPFTRHSRDDRTKIGTSRSLLGGQAAAVLDEPGGRPE